MTTVALWRFDDTLDAVRPRDEMGNVGELDIDTAAGIFRPLVVDAALGRGRRFLASGTRGYIAQDVVSGTTLLQRDMSVQVVLQWNLAAQAAYGSPGVIYARGAGTGPTERVSAGVELRVVNAAANAGEIRWFWLDSTSALKYQLGGQFSPSATDFILLTATRRWISTTRVVLKYYLGDQLLSESESADGDIAGGTTGTTQIGAGFAFTAFFDGVIDELRVVDYELAPEEIAATYRRITIEQPGCYALLRELHDPGFPISQDPASRVQRETRQIGHGLGFASAQAQNAADNLLPDHAYGNALVRQEVIAGVSPKVGDSLEKRRARVLARWAELGVTDAGIRAALAGAAGPLDTAGANLQIIGQNCDTLDDGSSLNNTSRWFYNPPPGGGSWAVSGGAITVVSAAEILTFDGTQRLWKTGVMGVDGAPYPGRGMRGSAKVTLTTFGANGEAGIYVGNQGTGNYLLVSLKYSSAGFVNVTTEFFLAWASQGEVVQTVTPIAWTTGWLQLYHFEPATLGTLGSAHYTIGWSTVAEGGPFTTVDVTSPGGWMYTGGFAAFAPHGMPCFGPFLRSTGGGATTATVGFQNIRTRSPHGARSQTFFVYRDPTLPGAPDFDAAQVELNQLKQAHTVGTVTASKKMLAGDPNSLCGRTPLA